MEDSGMSSQHHDLDDNNILSEHSRGVDVLTEGQHYLGISLLVYQYSNLRELCRMGHTRLTFEEMDVNAAAKTMTHNIWNQHTDATHEELFESTARRKNGMAGLRRTNLYGFSSVTTDLLKQQRKRQSHKYQYLHNKTKTASDIISITIDEIRLCDHTSVDVDVGLIVGASPEYEKRYARLNSVDVDVELIVGSTPEYEKSINNELHMYIADSKVDQLNMSQVKFLNSITRQVAESSTRTSDTTSSNPNVINGLTLPPHDTQSKVPIDIFAEGSIMANLIKSNVEIVWFSDLTQNDVVYGICCEKEKKRVTVVFRGSVSGHNWLLNVKLKTSQVVNPIMHQYEGRQDFIEFHSGFSLYMLRPRKDTGLNKIQEIALKVNAIAQELAPDGNYELSITGHSLGGALATVLGFYMAASKNIHAKQIRIFSFASPRVGTASFLHAYKQLEKNGLLRHARFSNSGDAVTNFPSVNYSSFMPWKWKRYIHVGMRIQLHQQGMFSQRALDISYPLDHDWKSESKRAITNCHLFHLNTPARFAKNHSLSEIQKRLHYCSSLDSASSFFSVRHNHIKSLDKYYVLLKNGEVTSQSPSNPRMLLLAVAVMLISFYLSIST